MKLGIIGTGMIVKDLLTTINELNIELTSLLATPQTKDEGAQLCSDYGITNLYLEYTKLLEGDADTIYIALPNHLHFIFAKEALEKGKHVIIEKPIVPCIAELMTLKKIADEKNLIVIEAMNIQYLPTFKLLKDKISKIGEIKIAQFNYSQYSSRYNDFKKGIIHPAFDPKKHGGALMDLNIYNIHSLIGLFGSPIDSTYYANIENNIDTSGIIQLNYGNMKATSIAAKDCKAPVVMSIQGTEGCIVIETPMNILTRFTIHMNSGEIERVDSGDIKHRLYHEFKEFSSIIDNLDINKANEMFDFSIQALNIIERSRLQNMGELS
jgi:predicted dehydrogenase